MEGFSEPHPTQRWLVDAFFRLHRRRGFTEVGPTAISYTDIIALSDHVLKLPPPNKDLLFHVIEETDMEVLEYLYKRNTAKLEAATSSRDKRNEQSKV